jgi:hypothetical protein
VDPALQPLIRKFRDGQVQQNSVTLEGPVLTKDETDLLVKGLVQVKT